jgi:hypothetical protein
MTIALLVVQLHPGLWEDLSREPLAMLTGRVATLIGIGVGLTVLIVLLAMGSASLGWTGFRGKTLWDLLQLLIVPLVLVGIGYLFQMHQGQLAEERAQDEALQAYLDQMGALLLAKDGLRESEEGSEVRTLARARTLTVLERLDPERRPAVMQFLVETELVQRVEKRAPVISLFSANLSGTDLCCGADLRNANFGSADLKGAYLKDANLSNANLSKANLSNADLSDANLSDADLSNAYLRAADLLRADLSDDNLLGADLSDADLSDADLSNADLGRTHGVTKEGLEQQAESLEGTIMPDGTIYPGRYAASGFEPALSFSVSDGWRLSRPETTGWLSIEGPEGGELIFTNPRHVYDPSDPSEPKEVPAPENADEWPSWFQSHPSLVTSKPLPVSVGGASGMRIDVTTSSTPKNYPQEVCGEQPCIPLYPSGKTPILSYEEFKYRFVIVDVGGEPVLIDVAAPTDKFDEFLPKAQKVLDTVEWTGG